MLIITESHNQLANQLFNLGHVVATAIECRASVLNPGFGNYGALYPSMAADGLCRFPSSALPLVRVAPQRRQRSSAFVERVARSLRDGKLRRLRGVGFHLHHSGQVSPLEDPAGIFRMDAPEFQRAARGRGFHFLTGPLFRNDGAFLRQADGVRRFLTPHAHHLESSAAAVARARRAGDMVVAVHVRHGDWATYAGGRYFYPVETYRDFMDQTAALFPERRLSFLVCSNAVHPAEAFGAHPTSPGPGVPVEDLHAMALTDAIIASPSTFAAWASFFGKVPLCVVHDPRRALQRDDFQPVTCHCTRQAPATSTQPA